MREEGQAQERRGSERHRLFFPTRIDTPSSERRFGMTRNISAKGMLLSTPSRLRIGERAVLAFKIGDDGPTYSGIQGRIVRLEINNFDEVGIWRYLCAIRFNELLPEDVLRDAATEPGRD